MATVAENLNSILEVKAGLKTAIEGKGISMTGVTFPQFVDKVNEIVAFADFKTPTQCWSMTTRRDNLYFTGIVIGRFSGNRYIITDGVNSAQVYSFSGTPSRQYQYGDVFFGYGEWSIYSNYTNVVEVGSIEVSMHPTMASEEWIESLTKPILGTKNQFSLPYYFKAKATASATIMELSDGVQINVNNTSSTTLEAGKTYVMFGYPYAPVSGNMVVMSIVDVISEVGGAELMEVSILQAGNQQTLTPEIYEKDGFSKVTVTTDQTWLEGEKESSRQEGYTEGYGEGETEGRASALAELTEADATESDVVSGKKYYDNNGILKEGTKEEPLIIDIDVEIGSEDPEVFNAEDYSCDGFSKVTVTANRSWLQGIRDEGYNEGHTAGYDEGYDRGEDDGRSEALNELNEADVAQDDVAIGKKYYDNYGELKEGTNEGPNLINASILLAEDGQVTTPDDYGSDVDGFNKVKVTLDPSLPEQFKEEALAELTEATVSEDEVTEGKTYYGNNGILKIGTMQGGGGSDNENAIIARTISGTYTNNSATKIGTYAFDGCSSLSSIIMNNLSSIGYGAFMTCNNLRTISFPNCTYLGTYAFYDCWLLSEITLSPSISSIGSYAFYRCSNIRTIDFPNCSIVNPYAYISCIRLSDVNLPNCVTVGSYAFSSCKSLVNLNLPNCVSIYESAFCSCYNLVELSLPKCTYMSENAFRNCSSLTNASLPLASRINYNVFYYCINLENVYAPKCTWVNTQAFGNCSKLASIDLPICSVIGASAFRYCSSLSTVSIPKCTSISSFAFMECRALDSIYVGLSISTVCSLNYSNAFASTPIVNSTYLGHFGSIYVPSSLVNNYKTATNWTYFSDRIVGI